MHLGHVTTSTEASVWISCILFWLLFLFFVFFTAFIIAFFVDTFLPDVHEVDVLLSGVVVDGGGEFSPFFITIHGVKSVFQLDVRVVGVIERCDFVLPVVDVHRDFKASVFEELAQLEVGGNIKYRSRLKGIVGDAAVQGAETS